jgi:hypothetical protein
MNTTKIVRILTTPMYRDGLILQTSIEFAAFYKLFLRLGDHGLYCEIRYEMTPTYRGIKP